MRVSSTIADIIQIINRRHSDLQGLNADDHKQYDLTDGTRNYIKNILTTKGDLLVRGENGLERLPAGESGKILKSQGENNKPIWDSYEEKGVTLIPSNNLRVSADNERSGNNTTYQKVKEIKVVAGGTIRVSFQMKRGPENYACYGRIYKNGTPVGIERAPTSTTVYETYVEDISGVCPGDLIQLYCYVAYSGGRYYTRNFRIYYDRLSEDQVLLN